MSKLYNLGLTKIANNTIDFLNDNIAVLLVNTSHSFTSTDEFVANVSSNEVSGTGYERKSIPNISITYDTGTDKLVFDADKVSFIGINAGTIASAIIYQQGANDDVSSLIADVDFNDFPTNGSDVDLAFSADGIFTIANDVT